MDSILDDFNLKGTDEPPKNVEEPKKPFSTLDSINLAHLLGKDTMGWIRGDLTGKPQEIKQLGDDFAQKINWYIGAAILAQYSRIPALFDALEQVSVKLFAEDELSKITDPKQLVDTYNSIQKEINQIMEFARRFVVQNKDFLADNSNFFDRSLFEKIKALPTDLVRDYLTVFQIVERKGHGVLQEFIKQHNT